MEGSSEKEKRTHGHGPQGGDCRGEGAIRDLWDIYTMGFYLAIKKKKVLSFATVWMDLENIMLSEMSQERQIPFDFGHMWNLTNKLR